MDKVHIPIPKWRNGGIERINVTKTKLKPSRMNITAHASMPAIWITWWHDLISNTLGNPHPYGLALCRPHGLSLGLTPFIAWRIFSDFP
jgi:hypothetical protein